MDFDPNLATAILYSNPSANHGVSIITRWAHVLHYMNGKRL